MGFMNSSYQFNEDIINTLVGGQSALGIKKLNIKTFEQATQFLLAYGFDPNIDNQSHIWDFHRRSLVFIQEKLGYDIQRFPSRIRDPRELADIRHLVLFASQSEDIELQKAACSLLRVMHVFVHAETDLSSYFAEEVQKQILVPIQDKVFFDGKSHFQYLKDEEEQIPLIGFDVKPFKTSTSTVIKLLAKPDAIAMKVYDKLGVRFVTRNIFDSFRVIRFLTQRNLISYPHIMPDQSTNTLYPTDLFLEACRELQNEKAHSFSNEEIEEILHLKLIQDPTRAKYFKKENLYSADNYRFVKFIARKRVIIENEMKKPHSAPLSFFYPFEVQILDEASAKMIQDGPSHHMEYKERQKQAALKRIFPDNL